MGKHISWQYNKNRHQKEFHRDITSKFLHLSGGFGSGKTHALCMKAIQLSYLNKHIPGGLLCPSYGDFKKDVKPLLEEILDRHKVKYRYTDMKYYFPWSKAPMYVVTGKNKLRGPNWGWAVINEATLIPWVRYKEVVGRVRLKRAPRPQIASSGTPEGFGSDYHEHLIETPFSANVRVIYGSTRDNLQNLSDDYIPSLEAAFDKIMLDAYLDGLFVNMVGNRFYYNYGSKNEDTSIVHDEMATVHAMMDFNVEHMTTTLWHFDGYRLLGFDEIVIPNNADTEKMCNALIDRGYTPDRTIVYPDPAGKARSTKGNSDVQIIKNCGFMDIKVRSQAPPFRRRQLNANNLLDKRRVLINPVKMPTMKRDFLAVTQDPGTYEKLKDNPKLTHASDGFDYGVDHLFPFSGKRSNVSSHKYK